MDIIDYILLTTNCNHSNCNCIHNNNKKKDKSHTINTIDHINSTSISKSKYTGNQWPEDPNFKSYYNTFVQVIFSVQRSICPATYMKCNKTHINDSCQHFNVMFCYY